MIRTKFCFDYFYFLFVDNFLEIPLITFLIAPYISFRLYSGAKTM